MFYKHLKKLTLALTGFFWASCNNTTITEPLYGVPPNLSSSSEISQSSAAEPTSSESISSSSQAESSSSEFTQIMPAYGVISPVSCYIDAEEFKTSTQVSEHPITEFPIHCEDGVNCIQRDSITGYESEYPCRTIIDEDGIKHETACLDYGVIATTETTYSCDDGRTYNEEEFRKQYNRIYTNNTDQKKSSSSTAESFSSDGVTCTPGDSTLTYYAPSYSADIAKMNAEERAKRTGVEKIDSLKNTLQATPQCLADLRQQLDSFVALYGVPVIVHPDEVCSDGTVRPTEEYLKYQKMKEEWEKNKPALDEECQKIYEEKLENIQKRINKCLNPFGTDQT